MPEKPVPTEPKLTSVCFSRAPMGLPSVPGRPRSCGTHRPLAGRGWRPPQSSLPRVDWVGPRLARPGPVHP
eukprot:8593517-Heterocapsa_arctica.AAC.1